MIPLTNETDCWVLLDAMSWCCDYILKKDFSWRLQSKAPNPARANYFYIINHQEQMALHFAPRFWDWDAIMKGIMSTGFRSWEYFWKISKFKFDWLSVAIRCIKWLKYSKIVYNTKTKIGFFHVRSSSETTLGYAPCCSELQVYLELLLQVQKSLTDH